jgi:hypothetical protein
MTPAAAATALQNLGYTPVGVPDGTARDQVVVSQQPAANTPQDGGQVVYHYPAVAAEPMVLYRASNNDEVWVLRFQSDPTPPGYTLATGVIGYAYRPGTTGLQFTTQRVNGYDCVGSTTTCYGYTRNHFYSHGVPPDIQLDPGWTGPNPEADFIAGPAPGTCGAAQVPLWRTWYFAGSTHTYKLEGTSNPTATGSEFLGCLWA